jgi:hypothetical protein
MEYRDKCYDPSEYVLCVAVLSRSVVVRQGYRHPLPEVDASPSGSDYAVQSISGVAEPGNDIADVIEALIHPAQHDLHGSIVP